MNREPEPGPATLEQAAALCRTALSGTPWDGADVAAAPHFAPIAELVPKLLATDFSHGVVGRDYLFREFLPGVPASAALAGLADTGPFWAELGNILARIHAVPGPGFGRIQGPLSATWSEALSATFADMAADMHDAGLAFGDIRTVAMFLGRHGAAVDEVHAPRLLHGDLWIDNVLLERDSPVPHITGVADSDRASWGDPLADWTFHLLRRRKAAEKEAFWRGYGGQPHEDEGARIRQFFYRARSLGEARLEYHRLGMDAKVEASYPRLERELDAFISSLP